MSMFKRIFAAIFTTALLIVGSAGIAAAHDYTVKPGDTLGEISAEWEVPGGWESLHKWNSGKIDNPNLIYPGQVLNIKEHKFIGDGRGSSKSEPKKEREQKRQSRSSDRSEPKKQAPSRDKVRPATGPITSNYLGGYRSNGGHSGTDFAGSDGNAYAAADGTVISGLWDGAYGNHLKIDHGGGIQTWYAHLASFAVSAGEQVSAGEKVGTIGETGNTTGPHLHFEVRINGEMSDPLAWLD